MDLNNKKDLVKIDSRWKNIEFDINKVYTRKISEYITDEHIDIIVRYLYVKAYIENRNYDKYKKLYEKMQDKRIGYCNLEEFNEIIDSFKENGYLKEYPIPINKKGKMLNGSHRLSCCLYFNINPYVVEFNEEDHFYDLKWFKENGFLKEEIDEIIETKNQLTREYEEKKIELEKIYDAMISPLNENNELDIEYFKKHADYLYKNKIRGLFICGNTGNGMNLNNDIKKEILKTAISMEKFSIICHVGAEIKEEIFDFVKYTNNSNIKCIACIPPYKKINEFKYIKQFYETLAKLSNKPVLIYHIPSITGINLDYKEIIELLKINNVIGIKYTDTDLEKLRMISKEKDKYIFFGRDDYLYSGLNNGAKGGIGGCYNLFPNFIYNIINEINPEENQEKLNYCIKKLRELYPKIPGGEFVLKSLKIKNYISDEDFYKKIKGE